MNLHNVSFEAAVRNAKALLDLGQEEVYLSDGSYPWPLTTDCEPGGSHRIDIHTSVWFTAYHSSGLRFRWSFDIEPRSANGSGSYHVDVSGCQRVLSLLSDEARIKFRIYLSECATKIREKGQEYQKIADDQAMTATILAELTKGETG